MGGGHGERRACQHDDPLVRIGVHRGQHRVAVTEPPERQQPARLGMERPDRPARPRAFAREAVDLLAATAPSLAQAMAGIAGWRSRSWTARSSRRRPSDPHGRQR